MMRIAVLVVALIWSIGTVYISFLLFSTRTSIRDVTGLNEYVIGKARTGGPAGPPGPLQDTPKASSFSSSFSSFFSTGLRGTPSESHASNVWLDYKKYKKSKSDRIWPINRDRDDRILNQINANPTVDKTKPPKTILLKWGLGEASPGRKQFIDHGCPVNWCSLTEDEALEPLADLIVYKDTLNPDGHNKRPKRNPNQVTLLFNLESPLHSVDPLNSVNWTATYRTDSVINAPYEKFAFFKNYTGLPSSPIRNFAKGKTKKVAWFVSNCWATNKRLSYAKQLANHIQVDIYGSCGHFDCPRENDECWNLLRRDYKFYLSFENSNCRDYITEKFFVNALRNDVLPIVMGAHPDDYKKLAPPNSYIHVDDFESPKALAKFLRKLDADDHLYNQYFLWRGTGEFIDTKFWCRLCALIHERENSGISLWYENLTDWMNGPGICLDSRNTRIWFSWNDLKDGTSSKRHLKVVERLNN